MTLCHYLFFHNLFTRGEIVKVSFVNLCFLEVVVFSKDTSLHKVVLDFSLYALTSIKKRLFVLFCFNPDGLVNCQC